jgi:hypothetical protein
MKVVLLAEMIAAKAAPVVEPQDAAADTRGRQPASALMMKLAARTGLAIKAVCDPLIDSVTAPMRLAMNRSASGGMAPTAAAASRT